MLGVNAWETWGRRGRRFRGKCFEIPITSRATDGFCLSLIRGGLSVTLGVLQDGSVAEIILFGCLDAEGSLRSHAPHRLAHVQRPDVLQLGQTDVQGAKRT